MGTRPGWKTQSLVKLVLQNGAKRPVEMGRTLNSTGVMMVMSLTTTVEAQSEWSKMAMSAVERHLTSVEKLNHLI